MKSVILGTAGHVDHGKTVLVEALTGVNTDRWEEERQRGITIDLGFAPFPAGSPDLEISVIDVPGHEDFVRNMLAGATGFDVLLLVVAADEGPMPQTREHLWIARFLGVEQGVVAISKSDLVDAEWRGLVIESVREEVERITGTADWPVLPVSAVRREGLEELSGAILDAARAVPGRRVDDLFRLPVDRAFSVRGVGTVVTGTVWSGRVETGGEVRLLPQERRARVRGVQVHGHDVAAARAGQRAAVALVGLDRSQVGRGDMLVSDPVWRETRYLGASLQVMPTAPWPLKHWQRVRFHLGTAETLARVATPGQTPIRPGEGASIELRTERPVVARAGDRFVVRFYSPVTTIGGGRVIDPWAERRGRGARELAAAPYGPSAGERLRRAIERRAEGTSIPELAVLVGLSPPQAQRELADLAAAGSLRQLGDLWFSASALRTAREATLGVLDREQARDAGARGVGLEVLRGAVGAPAAVVNAVLAELESQGVIRVEGSVAARADHVPRLRPEQESIAAAARERIQAGGRAPPTVKELATALALSADELIPVLKFLRAEGELVAVTADLYYGRQVINEVELRVRATLERSQVATPSELARALGVTRKYVIPLLEYLDAAGLTQRTAAGRVLRELS